LVLSGHDFSISGLLPLIFQTKYTLASATGLGFVSGHDFSISGLLLLIFQTKHTLASGTGLGFVSGHDFSRAVDRYQYLGL
jgi:hypothetical protein